MFTLYNYVHLYVLLRRELQKSLIENSLIKIKNYILSKYVGRYQRHKTLTKLYLYLLLIHYFVINYLKIAIYDIQVV